MRALVAVLVLIALAPAAAFVVAAPREIAAVTDRTYPESVVAWNAAELRAGRALYRDWRREPYVITPYAPLGYALDAVLSSGTPESARRAGRIVSLLAALAIAALLAAVVARAGASRAACGALAVAFFLGSALLVPYAYSARPDLLAALLSLIALALGAGLLGRARPVVAAIVCVLAILTKQSAVAAPASLLLFFLLQRQRRDALLFLGAFALVLVTAVGALEIGTHGEFFRNVVVGNAAPLSLSHVWKTGGKALLAGLSGTAFALALGAVVRRDATSIALRTWLAVAVVVGLFSLAKTGSDENYLIEASVPAAGLAAMVVVGTRSRLAMRVAVAAAWGAIAFAMECRANEGAFPDSRDAALAALRGAPDPLWVQSPELAVACGKPVVMLDAYNFRLLEESGVFDPGSLADRFTRREMGAALLEFDPFAEPRVPTYQGAPRVSPALVDAMRGNYRESVRIGRYRLLVPITAPAGR